MKEKKDIYHKLKELGKEQKSRIFRNKSSVFLKKKGRRQKK